MVCLDGIKKVLSRLIVHLQQRLESMVLGLDPCVLFVKPLDPLAATLFSIRVKLSQILMNQIVSLTNEITQTFLLCGNIVGVGINPKLNPNYDFGDRILKRRFGRFAI